MPIAQATEEAFGPQKRTSSTSKQWVFSLLSFVLVIFTPCGPDPHSQWDPDPNQN
jgi:hypothetical protein